MKGLLISLAVFVLYAFGSMLVSHVLKPSHHSRVFVPGLLVGMAVFFAIYALTPASLGFLPREWRAEISWLDAAYGCVVFLMNGHSFIDFFFGFNGGFSMSVMLEILRREKGGATTPALVGCYLRPDGFDKIYGWRLPRLAESGMIVIDGATGTCRLTPAGLRVARVAVFCKRLLNLGAGG